jgi:hypothetical protein
MLCQRMVFTNGVKLYVHHQYVASFKLAQIFADMVNHVTFVMVQSLQFFPIALQAMTFLLS